jgi:hypothetical protein
MPRYFFNVTDGTDLADHSGVELASDQEALAHAKRIAGAIVEAIPQHSGPQRHVSIVLDDGTSIADVPVHAVDARIRQDG